MEKLLKISPTAVGLIIMIGILDIVCSIMFLSWKKAGFYEFTVTTIIIFIKNTGIKLPIVPAVLGLFGIGLLYGIFQIKPSGSAAWFYLKHMTITFRFIRFLFISYLMRLITRQKRLKTSI